MLPGREFPGVSRIGGCLRIRTPGSVLPILMGLREIQILWVGILGRSRYQYLSMKIYVRCGVESGLYINLFCSSAQNHSFPNIICITKHAVVMICPGTPTTSGTTRSPALKSRVKNPDLPLPGYIAVQFYQAPSSP